MAYAAKHEIVIDRNLTPPWAGAIEEVAHSVGARLLGAMPETEVAVRYMDENEQANFEASVDPADNYAHLNTYLLRQKADREAYGIQSTATALVTAQPIKVRDPVSQARDMYGYGIEQFGEVVISLDRYIREVGGTLRGLEKVIDVAETAAFTIQHELGHLDGLVEMTKQRARAGKHCGNICIMQSVHPTSRIKELQARLIGTHFCPDCLIDLHQ
jgi:hypothetical protein